MLRETVRKIKKEAENKGFEIGVQIGIREGVNIVNTEVAKILLKYEKIAMKEDSKKRQKYTRKIDKLKKSGL